MTLRAGVTQMFSRYLRRVGATEKDPWVTPNQHAQTGVRGKDPADKCHPGETFPLSEVINTYQEIQHPEKYAAQP